LVDFSGKNATQFYNIIKQQKFNWNLFDLRYPSLGRFDICYFREHELANSNEGLDSFLVHSRSKILRDTNTRHINLVNNVTGKLLRINRRDNAKYYRVYETNNGLRFELEIKKRNACKIQKDLFGNHIEKFEHELTTFFYQYSSKLFPLDNIYTDGLVDFLRRYADKQIPEEFLITSYLENKIVSQDEVRLFHLLQFLSFIQTLNEDFKNSELWIKN